MKQIRPRVVLLAVALVLLMSLLIVGLSLLLALAGEALDVAVRWLAHHPSDALNAVWLGFVLALFAAWARDLAVYFTKPKEKS
jgi:uncharacterized membrane protein